MSNFDLAGPLRFDLIPIILWLIGVIGAIIAFTSANYSGFFTFSLIAVIPIAYIVWLMDKEKKEINRYSSALENQMNMLMDSLNDFQPGEITMGSNLDTGLVIDKRERKICLIDYVENKMRVRSFSRRGIVEASLLEDEVTVTQTSRKSQVGGAVVGGMLLGEAGAIIGGLSGKQTSSQGVKSIDLKVVVNDIKYPILKVNFLKVDDYLPKTSEAYMQIKEYAEKWHAMMSVLIKRAEEEEKQRDRLVVDVSKLRRTNL